MIRKLVEASVDRRVLVLVLTAIFAVVAGIVASSLKLDALPDLTNNQVLVLTRAPGLTPEEVERFVTRPLETSLGGAPRLLEQRSVSRYGISAITLVFHDDVPPYLARQIVTERLAIELPPGVQPPELGPLTGGLGEIFHFTLSSGRRTPAELYELAVQRVAPLLRGVNGVVEVNTWGGAVRTLEVAADPLKLSGKNLTLEDLRDGLSRTTGTAPGAALAMGNGQLLLRAVARPDDAQSLGAAVVFRDSGTPTPLVVRASDVAEVKDGQLVRLGAATANGRGETLYVMVQMLRDENALDVIAGIHKAMTAVRAALPEDVRVDVVYDRSVLVNATLHTVGKNLLEGGLLVIAVLFLMLGSFRAGLIVASVIPLAMLGATAAMATLGVPGNLMSLGALDFGLLVDGAVVVVESVFHALAHLRPEQRASLSRADVRGKIREVAGKVAVPTFTSVLIILLVYVPVLSLTGADGKLFRPMALTVVFALGFALILSLTYVPAAAAMFLRAKDVPAKPPVPVRILERVYPPFVRGTAKRPLAITLGAVVLIGLGFAAFKASGTEFTPQLDEGDLVIQTTRAADISLDSSADAAGRLEAALVGHIPEVKQVVSRIGSPAVATDVMGVDQADVFVSLKPRAEWRKGLSRDELIGEVEAALKARAPGGEPSFTQPIQMRFNELLGGSVTDVAVSVYGEDLVELRRVAEAIRDAVAQVPSAVDARVLAPPAVALSTVEPRQLDVASVGLAARDVLDAVQALRTGLEVGSTWSGMLRVPIMLKLQGTESGFGLEGVPLPVPGGGVVPLSRVANVNTQDAPSLVNRRNGQRRLVVGFNVRGGSLGSVVQAAEAKVAQSVKLPRGYRLEWGGQYETMQQAQRRLAVVIPAVLVLIFGVLVYAFRKLRPALIIFSHVPFACVGGALLLWARGLPVSLPASIGFIALSGIAVLNGVVLLSRILELEKEGSTPRDAALTAATERARPVLMTALVAALGFVPMMIATGVGAEVQRPLATVVVGGLVTSTLLTLAILPSVYRFFHLKRRHA